MKSPTTLVELGESLQLWDDLQAQLEETESRIAPIHDQFAILEKYEVVIPEEVVIAVVVIFVWPIDVCSFWVLFNFPMST